MSEWFFGMPAEQQVAFIGLILTAVGALFVRGRAVNSQYDRPPWKNGFKDTDRERMERMERKLEEMDDLVREFYTYVRTRDGVRKGRS